MPYTIFKLKVNDEKAPDWGLGQGVIITQRVQLDDDPHTAAVQIIKHQERMLEEHIVITVDEITEVEYSSED